MDSSERIYKELLHEEAAIWYIADQFGEKIMVKVLSNAIKTLIRGCKIEFLFGKDNHHIFPFFHSGVIIWDDPVHYLQITSIQRFTQEHNSLKKIMSLESVYIHFHNELTMCQATATLSFPEEDKRRVTELLGNIDDLYSGAFNEFAVKSLNCFDYTIDKTNRFSDVKEIDLLRIEGQLSDWIIMDNTFIGVHENNPIIIDDIDEGGVLEKQVWVSLESIFNNSLFRSPKIPDKYGFRELTDVFAFHEKGVFLIETKALSIPEVVNERDMVRKVKGVQKQILKAINQLKGASRKVASGMDVFDNNHNLIHFDKTICPHCIVLVSELLPFGEWKMIVDAMIKAMQDQPMFLNVMDLKEFMTYVGFCRGNKEVLDVSLMDRTSQFVQLKNIHMKTLRNKLNH